MPRSFRSMCLVKRVRAVKQPPSSRSTPISSIAGSKPRTPIDSSVEFTNSYAGSSHEFSKESKASQQSSSSASSLNNIRDMLSDGPIIFQYKDLMKATDNFNPSKKLGTSVYRGKVNNSDVAIVLDKMGGANTNFVAEIKSLCSVHHSNLVRLLGGCMTGDHVYLVYEFVDGGNLRQYLHSKFSPGFSALPSWMSRLQVILDVAKGLEYLHHHLHTPTVHKYIKSSNILLDNDLHARIAYFGVARIRGEKQAETKVKTISEEEIQVVKEVDSGRKHSSGRTLRRTQSVKITGTHGYMAPEYVSGGLISPKLDIYAFGVILLEVLSGREAVTMQADLRTNSMKKTLLPETIAALFAEKDTRSRIRSWMDPLLRDKFPLDSAFKTAELAKRCVDPDPELRPDMHHVSSTLEQIWRNSKQWESNMMASKELLTSTMEAR